MPQPATKHDRSVPSRLTPVDDEAIHLVWACGLLTPSTSVPGIGLGGLVPQPDSAVLGGLPLTSTDFRDFRARGPRVRTDDLSTPTGRFIARVSTSIGTDDDRLGRIRLDDWDAQLPRVEFTHNNSVSAATGLAHNEVHMGRLPCLPLTVFDRSGVACHQSLARDHLAYCDLARQQHANDIVREMHSLTVSRVKRRKSALSNALRQVPNFVVGNWVWLCNTASTICQGTKAGTDAKVHKTKFAPNWTRPCKILAVGPCSSSDTPDGTPLWDKLLYLDLLTDIHGADAHRRVSVERCKPCINPDPEGTS